MKKSKFSAAAAVLWLFPSSCFSSSCPPLFSSLSSHWSPGAASSEQQKDTAVCWNDPGRLLIALIDSPSLRPDCGGWRGVQWGGGLKLESGGWAGLETALTQVVYSHLIEKYQEARGEAAMTFLKMCVCVCLCSVISNCH